MQTLELLQLCAQLNAVVLFPLQSFLQVLPLFPLNTQLILQAKPENRCSDPYTSDYMSEYGKTKTVTTNQVLTVMCEEN